MYGRVERENRGRMVPGQDLAVAGYIGLRGTVSIARILDGRMREVFPADFVYQAQSADRHMVSGGLEYFIKYGATECEAISEGGIMAALWNLTGAYRVGMEIELRRIPILQETVEVCELADVNPYRLWSEGCFLLAADSGWDLVRRLRDAGIPAVTIGRITGDRKRLIRNAETVTYLDRPQEDELWRFSQ